MTSFLSIVSRYAVHVQHLAGSSNIPSDFSSRNAAECSKPRCQVCTFIALTEDFVVCAASVQDIRNLSHLPFTTRSAWYEVQAECPDLRRTHAYLKQGTRPSKKATNMNDVKRYLNVASITKDGLIVVPHRDPLSPHRELIVVPRSAIHGLITALHVRLEQPTTHQLNLAMKRHFYALDMTKAIERVRDTCAALHHLPQPLLHQTTNDPPAVVAFPLLQTSFEEANSLSLSFDIPPRLLPPLASFPTKRPLPSVTASPPYLSHFILPMAPCYNSSRSCPWIPSVKR